MLRRRAAAAPLAAGALTLHHQPLARSRRVLARHGTGATDRGVGDVRPPLPGVHWTGYSLRIGLASTGRKKGKDGITIADQGGWARHSRLAA